MQSKFQNKNCRLFILFIFHVSGLRSFSIFSVKILQHYYFFFQKVSRFMWHLPLSVCPLTTLCDKVCQSLVTGRWFSVGFPVSSTNKTECHDITEILKVALNTINHLTSSIVRWSLHFTFVPKENTIYIKIFYETTDWMNPIFRWMYHWMFFGG